MGRKDSKEQPVTPQVSSWNKYIKHSTAFRSGKTLKEWNYEQDYEARNDVFVTRTRLIRAVPGPAQPVYSTYASWPNPI
jgi:hypothetical protein